MIDYISTRYGTGGGASQLGLMTDVDDSTLQDGYILKYDGTTEKWVTSALDAIEGTISDSFKYINSTGELTLTATSSTDTLNIEVNGYSTNNNLDITTDGVSKTLDISLSDTPTLDYIDFNLLGDAVTPLQGRVWYNVEDDTLNISHADGSVQQVGQEFFLPPTINKSGELIENGSLVMMTGVQGDKMEIAKAVSDGTVPPNTMLGVATADIPINSDTGKIVTHGIVRNVDTNGWTVGTILYHNPLVDGGWTNVKPEAPAIKAAIGLVLRGGTNNGWIYVRMSTGSVLGDTDSNVEFDTLSDKDFIVYNGTNERWENQSLNTFNTISVSGQNDVVADTISDSLTLVAGTNITITTDDTTDSITINSAGSSYTAGEGLTLSGAEFSLINNTAGDADVGALSYNGVLRSSGKLYGGTTDPVSTTRLNYDGNFHATAFYGDGSNLTGISTGETYTAGDGISLNGTTFSLSSITAGDTTTGAVYYNGTTKAAGQFDGGTTDPTNTTRLNYDGNFHATNFYGDGSNLTGITSGATLTDDASTDTTQYLGMARATTGAWTEAYTASTKLYFNPSTGTLNSTEFNSLSDENYKTNILRIDDANSTIDQLEGVEFNWIGNNHKSAGVIAQELEQILPHLVSTNDDGIKSVNYNGLVGYLIEGNKELNKRVTELENVVELLIQKLQ